MHAPNPQPTLPEHLRCDPPTPLTSQQLQAAHLLASGHSLSEICHLLQIGRATFYRWRQQPAFCAYLHELQQDAADQARCQALFLMTQALALVQQTLTDPSTPLALRLKLSFQLLRLYSRPSYLQPLQQLCTDPLEEEAQQMRQELRAAGDTREQVDFAPDIRQLFRDERQRFLQEAMAFDQSYPDPAALIAPLLAPAKPQQPTKAAQPAPARDSMRQNETASRSGDALDAALAGLRQGIAKVGRI